MGALTVACPLTMTGAGGILTQTAGETKPARQARISWMILALATAGNSSLQSGEVDLIIWTADRLIFI